MESVSLKDLVKTYDRRPILRGVSLTASAGRITSILGPNGAGKTTTLRISLALIFPDRGEVRVLGEDPFKEKRVLKKVGYVQEIPNLPSFLTVEKFLELSARMKSVGREEINRVGDLLDLGGIWRTRIAKCSKGTVQRIAIAEGLLAEPEVLIMDEPYLGTDPLVTAKIRRILYEVKASGTCILMTSHDMDEVRRMSDEVYVMNRGGITFRGSPEEMAKRFLGIRVVVETEDLEPLTQLVKEGEWGEVLKSGAGKAIVSLKEDRREEFLRDVVERGVRVRGFYLDQDLEEAYEEAVRA